MVEVRFDNDGFSWTLINDAGRIIAYNSDRFSCESAAASAGKKYLQKLRTLTDKIDFRQGRAI